MDKLYINTSRVKKVNIDGVDFVVAKLYAFDGMRLFNRVATNLKPLVSLLNGKKEGENLDFSKLAELNIDDEKISYLIKEIVEMCQIGGRMVIFDMDMTTFKMPYLLAFEFLKHNYNDFLGNSPLLKAVEEKMGQGMDLTEMKKG
jgi:hypothetical protein